MTNARTGWNAAQRASERKLPTPRKMMGPVGEVVDIGHGTDKFDDRGRPYACSIVGRVTTEPVKCRGCGHHVCSCERVNPPDMCQHCGSSGSHATDCPAIHNQKYNEAVSGSLAALEIERQRLQHEWQRMTLEEHRAQAGAALKEADAELRARVYREFIRGREGI